MAHPILMPQAGQSMTEGKIVRWLVKEGARVRRGDPLLEIETDKANMEVEAPADGVLRKLLRGEGEVVPVLAPVGIIAGADEPLDLAALSPAGPPPTAAKTAPVPPAAPPGPARDAPAAGSGPRARVAASPLARRLASGHQIDLKRLPGTGPRGRIIRRDVEAALRAREPAGAGGRLPSAEEAALPLFAPREEYPPPSPRPPARVALEGMRKAIATALKRSKAMAPHFYATAEIDLTAALLARKAKEREGVQLSVNDLLLKAVALALADEPRVNCRVEDEAIDYPSDINIGIAVGLEEGLVVPVLLRAQTRSLAEIASESRRIIGLAREGKLVGAGQGTFTISNLGMFGVKCFTAVINPPEGAILAVGAAVERAVPRAGGFIPRKILEVTLSADHRAIDGLLAARFLLRLRRFLEEPARIL
jgi:pyruvate dehydrogenase E2 component (dihydrolipoamide acetyltransferase)